MISAPPSRRCSHRLLGDDERAADVDAELLVEDGEVEVGERGEVHPAGGVDDDVDAAEALGGRGEQRSTACSSATSAWTASALLVARLRDRGVGLLLVAA